MARRITHKSAKTKARRLQTWATQWASKLLDLPWGKDQPIRSREMGQSGVDVVLVGEALRRLPFSIECKDRDQWKLGPTFRQAQENQIEGTDWVVFMRRSHPSSTQRIGTIAMLDGDVFFNILQYALSHGWAHDRRHPQYKHEIVPHPN